MNWQQHINPARRFSLSRLRSASRPTSEPLEPRVLLAAGRFESPLVLIPWNDSPPTAAAAILGDAFNASLSTARGWTRTILAPGQPGQRVTATFTLTGRLSAHPNGMVIYRVDGPGGAIEGLTPGSPGYLERALDRGVQVFFVQDRRGTQFQVEMEGGASYGLAIVGPRGRGFVSFPTANPDGYPHGHAQATENSSAGSVGGRLRFEEGRNGGDRDHDDLIVRYRFQIPSPRDPSPTLTVEVAEYALDSTTIRGAVQARGPDPVRILVGAGVDGPTRIIDASADGRFEAILNGRPRFVSLQVLQQDDPATGRFTFPIDPMESTTSGAAPMSLSTSRNRMDASSNQRRERPSVESLEPRALLAAAVLEARDLIPPDLTLSQVTPGLYTNADLVLSGSVFDTSGVAGLVISMDGTDEAATLQDGSFQVTKPIAGLSEGRHTIAFKPSDTKGNEGRYELAFTKDTVAPTAELEDPGEEPEALVVQFNERMARAATELSKYTLTKGETETPIASLVDLGMGRVRLELSEALAPGSYTLSLSEAITDLARNPVETNDLPFDITVPVNLPPIILVDSVEPGLIADENFTIHGVVTDPEGDAVDEVFLQIDEIDLGSIPVGEDGSFVIQTDFLLDGTDDGQHVIGVRAEDARGASSGTFSIQVSLQTVENPPGCSVVAPEPNGYLNGMNTVDVLIVGVANPETIELSFALPTTDLPPGPADFVTVDAEWEHLDDGKYLFTFLPETEQPDRSYLMTIKVVGVDFPECTLAIPVNLDRTAPSVDLGVPAIVNGTIPRLTISFDEPIKHDPAAPDDPGPFDAEGYEVTGPDGPVEFTVDTLETASLTSVDLVFANPLDSPGTYHVVVQAAAADLAGNPLVVPVPFEFTIHEGIPPGCSVVAPEPNGYLNGMNTVDVLIVGVANPETIELSFALTTDSPPGPADFVTVEAEWELLEAGKYRFTFLPETEQPDRNYLMTIKVVGVDFPECTLAIPVNLDRQAPTVSTTDPSGEVDGPIDRFVITFDEPIKHDPAAPDDPGPFDAEGYEVTGPDGPVEFTVDTSETASITSVELVFAEPLESAGTYHVVVQAAAADLAGNPLVVPVSFEFTIPEEGSPPEIRELAYPLANVTPGEQPAVFGIVADDGDPTLVSFSYQLDGESPTLAKAVVFPVEGRETNSTRFGFYLPVLDEGEHELTLAAIDKDGNESVRITRTFFVGSRPDNTRPTIQLTGLEVSAPNRFEDGPGTEVEIDPTGESAPHGHSTFVLRGIATDGDDGLLFAPNFATPRFRYRISQEGVDPNVDFTPDHFLDAFTYDATTGDFIVGLYLEKRSQEDERERGFADGKKFLVLQAIDASGQVSDLVRAAIFLDQTEPTLTVLGEPTIEHDTENSVYRITLPVTIEDAVDPKAKLELDYAIDDGELAPVTNLSTNNDGTCEATLEIFDTEVAPGSHQVRLVARDSAGNRSGLVTKDIVLETADIVLESAEDGLAASPTNLVVTATEADAVTLAWEDRSDNETGFRIAISRDGGAKFDLVGEVAANVTTFRVDNLGSNTMYHFKVRAANAYGFSDYTNVVETRTRRLGIQIFV